MKVWVSDMDGELSIASQDDGSETFFERELHCDRETLQRYEDQDYDNMPEEDELHILRRLNKDGSEELFMYETKDLPEGIIDDNFVDTDEGELIYCNRYSVSIELD